MNPYEADPKKIPATDRYLERPFYGRYLPRPGDFKPDPLHCNSSTPESLIYWGSVLRLCDTFNRVYESTDGGRDVFALGSVIVKSSHLKQNLDGGRTFRDYSLADSNEINATKLARSVLKNIQVPEIYFASKIHDRDVLVQERIPGVGLDVAWQYISKSQKASFKLQAREIVRQLCTIKPPADLSGRTYIVLDLDPVNHRGIQELEKEILFSSRMSVDLSFMHNDLCMSNIIVDNDHIAGLVDWEMTGWFGLEAAGEVHVQIRTPGKYFAALELPERFLNDVLFWNDLYENINL